MIKGICHICQRETELTYEHIPPNKAFNHFSTKVINGEDLINAYADSNRKLGDFSGLKYEIKQRGAGMYSLCETCNNFTGSCYGNEYIKFANTIHSFIPYIKENKLKKFGIHINDINPLLFSKQVLSMFCSTCPHITKKYPEIKDLLLNKDEKNINKSNFRLSMFILKDNKISYTGLQVMLTSDKGIRSMASIDAYPFGFVLEFEPKFPCKELDITTFFNEYEYDKKYNLEMGIPVLSRNTIFSCDYRTVDEIESDISNNKYENN